ncbi:MAG: dCTP deaminase [Candidatus Nanohaloarchaea archaeon]|nr:dCTP deaminase [Candidatus Nanohaloarchaea archaeon]
MRPATSDEIEAMVDGIVHVETQFDDGSLTLTVDTVEQVTGGGQLDFGGGEYEEAATEELSPERRDPDDDYGWWELDEGTYLVTCNESLHLPDDAVGVLQPWTKAARNGLNHDTRTVTGDHGPVRLLVHVEEELSIKENARTTELQVFR